jgi:uncharacterized lipoprotein
MYGVRLGALASFLLVLSGCATTPQERGREAAAASALTAEPNVTKSVTQSAAVANAGASWRELVQRFDRPPFRVDYLHRQRGEMVVRYAGGLGDYVACGKTIGSGALESQAADRLNSRMMVRLVEASDGSASVSVDAVHVVSLKQSEAARPLMVVVRAHNPAITGDGRYCWSTESMERLALLH